MVCLRGDRRVVAAFRSLIVLVMPMASNALVKYDAMCRAIDAALEVDEVKDVRDLAMAAALYAKQAKNSLKASAG
jgi:hypothetical protein